MEIDSKTMIFLLAITVILLGIFSVLYDIEKVLVKIDQDVQTFAPSQVIHLGK